MPDVGLEKCVALGMVMFLQFCSLLNLRPFSRHLEKTIPCASQNTHMTFVLLISLNGVRWFLKRYGQKATSAIFANNFYSKENTKQAAVENSNADRC